MFLKPVPKGPSCLTNVILPAACLGTFEPIDYPILLVMLSLGAARRFVMVFPPLKCTCTPTLS